MIRLSVFLLLLGLVGCGKYPSREQAVRACNEWKGRGASTTFVNKSQLRYQVEKNGVVPVFSRSCEEETAENQVLGKENRKIENGTWTRAESHSEDWNVVKHFRY